MNSPSTVLESPESIGSSPRDSAPGTPPTIALVGSPNTGKTSLFNALTGLRAKTANYHGTTVERKIGRTAIAGQTVDIVDLPGIYSLNAATEEERIASDVVLGKGRYTQPDAVIVIADASNLERSLFVISQLIEHNLKIIVALNMIDVAKSHGIHVNAEQLSEELKCPVVPIIARNGFGLARLRAEIAAMLAEKSAGVSAEEAIPLAPSAAACNACGLCPYQARYSWSDRVVKRAVKSPRVAKGQKTDAIDRVLTHPVVGLVLFFSVMLVVFYLIFSVASIPMDMIDGLFGRLGGWVAGKIPEGDFQSFLVNGVIGGVGGILVFLPQICILFFFLALLEDSGYLARAAFVVDRLMRRVGLPGTAFVPLLSAHACAIPAIMASRVIRDPRDRLVTILITPLMSCSARIPVYTMITALLFPANPGKAALLFTGAYILGILAALTMAFVFKKTILRGDSKALVIELPGYRIPGLRAVFLYTFDRAKVFVTQAGTNILLISIALWALATYPKTDAVPPNVAELTAQAEAFDAAGNDESASAMRAEAEHQQSRFELSHSFAGRLGKLIEPAVRPLGYDWQIGIGLITSFAAREVIVSTLAVVYGLGEDGADDEPVGLYDRMRRARHADGSPVFTVAASVSLLVFYVLAMQCLPTQITTKRETNSWKWPLFQLAYMTVLAYTAALVVYQTLRALGYA
ncbi:MAG: ferrous iron transport protein B [Kiritimatiellae bacterium]|nr:ferrous iron transport protein B [Kiritimatiellia bacterium]